MKLGEVKVEALKIMFTDYAEDIDIDNLQELKSNENYGKYVNAMPGAINRCFSRLEDSKVVPLKRIVLNKSQGTASNGRIRFELSDLIPDFGYLDRVAYESSSSYEGNCEYVMETNTLIVLREREEDYIFIYSPTLKRIKAGSEDTAEIELPDKIACIIPYFIKGDLFREDEPAEASQARNLFEASLESVYNDIKRRQTSVKTVFSQSEE